LELARTIALGLGLAYGLVMVVLGALLIRAARQVQDRKPAILGGGFVSMGVGSCNQVLGSIMASLYGGLLRVPMSEPNWADAYQAIATGIGVLLANVFFLTIQFYASLTRSGRLGALDKGLVVAATISSVAALTLWGFLEPVHGVYMRVLEARGLLAEHMEVPMLAATAVLAMAIVGYISCVNFSLLSRRLSMSADPVIAGRYGYALWGMVLMALAVTLTLAYPVVLMAGLGHLLMLLTVVRAIMFIAASILVYLGVAGPRWFVERLARKGGQAR